MYEVYALCPYHLWPVECSIKNLMVRRSICTGLRCCAKVISAVKSANPWAQVTYVPHISVLICLNAIADQCR
jgi:hypothetical protein